MKWDKGNMNVGNVKDGRNEMEGNRNGGNGNGGNGNRGNGNGNGGGNSYNFGGFVPARECTYQDFLKCQPLNFNGTKGVVRLTRWFEKIEMVFHISNCLERYQVKYALCTLLNSALTWWNSHKRTIGIEDAYAMSWIRYHPGKASVATDALSRNERAKPLRVRALVITINSNLPPQIHEARVEALKKENVNDDNLHGMDEEFENHLDGTLFSPIARYGSRHRHLGQQMLDVFKDEGRLSKVIRFTGIIRNTPLEIGKCIHGFYHKTTKENKQYDTLWVIVTIKKNYADLRRKPLEFQIGDKAMLNVSP
ncbi:hypothetical protein Tco_0272594 [Tanacetum coccineum]